MDQAEPATNPTPETEDSILDDFEREVRVATQEAAGKALSRLRELDRRQLEQPVSPDAPAAPRAR
jgi:hypothetical protein